MTVTIEDLGPIPSASIDVGDLTIFCGKNNVGKTYLTHTLVTHPSTTSLKPLYLLCAA